MLSMSKDIHTALSIREVISIQRLLIFAKNSMPGYHYQATKRKLTNSSKLEVRLGHMLMPVIRKKPAT